MSRTKGTLQMKLLTSQKMVTLTTEFDDYDGRILASEKTSEPVLQVQMDIEKAQETEVDVEITVIAYLFQYLGIAR